MLLVAALLFLAKAAFVAMVIVALLVFAMYANLEITNFRTMRRAEKRKFQSDETWIHQLVEAHRYHAAHKVLR